MYTDLVRVDFFFDEKQLPNNMIFSTDLASDMGI